MAPEPAPVPERSARARDVAVLLPLLGLFLLVPPVVTLFAVPLDIGGVPLVVVYLFGVWLALVICAARLARALGPRPSSGARTIDPPPG